MAGKPMTDKIMQNNLDWVYKRNHHEEQFDLDKVKHVKSTPREISIVDAVEFSGEFECFLPAYECKVVSSFDNSEYPSFEHALLVEKYRRADFCEQIRSSTDIIGLKRTLTKLAPQDEDQTLAWKEQCVSVAEVLLRDKFIRNKAVKQKLLSTGNKPLCFFNDYREHFWGMDKAKNGQNKLGKLLEQIRQELHRDTALDRWVASNLKLQEPGYVNISVTAEKLEKSALMDANEDSYLLKYRNTFLIGQGQDCDMLLKDKSISRNHALMVVEKETNTVHLIDLESSNGTEVDGVRLQPFKPTLVNPTAVVTFGALPINYKLSNSLRNVLTEEGFKESITEIVKKTEAGPSSVSAAARNVDSNRPESKPEIARPADRRPNNSYNSGNSSNDRDGRSHNRGGGGGGRGGADRVTSSSAASSTSSSSRRRSPSPPPRRRDRSRSREDDRDRDRDRGGSNRSRENDDDGRRRRKRVSSDSEDSSDDDEVKGRGGKGRDRRRDRRDDSRD